MTTAQNFNKNIIKKYLVITKVESDSNSGMTRVNIEDCNVDVRLATSEAVVMKRGQGVVRGNQMPEKSSKLR